MRIWFVVLAIAFTCGCAAYIPAPDAPAHHSQKGFRNLYIDDPDKSFFDYLRMRLFGETSFADHPSLAHQVPWQKTQPETLKAPSSEPQVTWLGHSTFLIQYKGISILTDPVFSDRASPVSFAGPKRYVGHVLDYRELPDIDLVVISHNHYDHLDQDTIDQLASSTHFAVPLGIGSWLQKNGVDAERISELDWWQSDKHSGVTFQALPSQHWSARGLGDRFATLWASWSLKIEDFHLWFAGDTGYNPIQFVQIGNAIEAIDLALIPIGAYAPRWFMRHYHVNPEEAVKIHRDVRAKVSVGMHWGTFPLTAEPPMEPVEKLRVARENAGVDAKSFSTMRIGETRRFAP